MELTTQRLLLRHWKITDADDLFRYAKDPAVGPAAGRPAHTKIEESRDIITSVLCDSECYAVCLKKDGMPIGSIELKLNGHTDMTDRDDECELGFWLGQDFWGQGIIPEAAGELLRHAFEDLNMKTVWCGYYQGNVKSKRAQEKIGFVYHHTCDKVQVPLMHEIRRGYTNYLTRERWLNLHNQ
jgi:ribosomal-protein-alanine N-acetyltransferase